MVCSRGGVRTAACGAVCVMPDRMAERVGRSVWLWGGRVVVLVVFTRSRPVTRSPAYSARLSRLLRPSRMASHLRRDLCGLTSHVAPFGDCQWQSNASMVQKSGPDFQKRKSADPTVCTVRR